MNTATNPHHSPTTTATAVPDKPSGAPPPPSPRHVFKLGLDVDLHFAVTAIQCDHGTIKPAQKFTRPQLLKWVREQTAAGHTVHTVYEACGFGYTLHEALVAAGAQSLITTPLQLSPERQRKNDRLDARALCVRLARHLDGHAHELQPIRIPSAAERERRELGRQREFWKRELRPPGSPLNKNNSLAHLTVDNPHRRCSAWLARLFAKCL